MTLTLRTGDLFASGAPAIGHGCNCCGLMGAGIARAVRLRYPDGYADYRRTCLAELRPGDAHLFQPKTAARPVLVNLVTQDIPGPNARLSWLESSLRQALTALAGLRVERLALPRIGCGIGGLTFANVLPVIDRVVRTQQDVDVEVWTRPSGLVAPTATDPAGDFQGEPSVTDYPSELSVRPLTSWPGALKPDDQRRRSPSRRR